MEADLNLVLEKSKTLSDLARFLFGKENYTNREKCKTILADNGIDWLEWLNIKREKPKQYCLYCGKELTGDYRKKFCNHSCSAKYNNKGTVRYGKRSDESYCLNCGSKLERTGRKYCCKECEVEFKYKEKVRQWKNNEVNGCDVNGDISHYVRKYMLESRNFTCEHCGFDTPNSYTKLSILQIHHIDGDCKNNKEENLQVLCPNCHALTENFGRRNPKSSRTNRYRRY